MDCELLNLSSHTTDYFESNRAAMLQYIPDGVRKTLEFGCGTGLFSALLKEKLSTWGVEIDHDAAKKAAQKLDKVIEEDAMTSLAKIPDCYFDCALFFDVLEHLVDPYTLLVSVKQKLTEGAVVIASIPNIRYYRALSKLVVHGDWKYRDHGVLDKTHLRFFTKKSIARMFDQLGFDIVTLEGMHPTSSRTFRILNAFLLNCLSDVRYKHFAVVAKPK
ncbi:MAG: class I SAM-dependent methyltransferase [Deltaproteobacteria bacterium]|nr:class I SAM-dependent methyltransferase [Deltaproteobacteria bacterium]